MKDYEPSSYGDSIAGMYDDWVEVVLGARNTSDAVACLFALAGDAPVLELGIGTGRLALPLAASGLRVIGIDASPRMLEKLRAKPGGAELEVIVGDFADVAVDGEFSLVFVAFNTLFALLTQDDQVRCFDNVARRLAPGGCFVVEAFVPDLGRFDRHQRAAVTHLELDSVALEFARHDPVDQRVDSQTVLLSERGIRLHPVSLRYAWPSELDLMAELAGLRLRSRWAGWDRRPFTSASESHVSVYEAAVSSRL